MPYWGRWKRPASIRLTIVYIVKNSVGPCWIFVCRKIRLFRSEAAVYNSTSTLIMTFYNQSTCFTIMYTQGIHHELIIFCITVEVTSTVILIPYFCVLGHFITQRQYRELIGSVGEEWEMGVDRQKRTLAGLESGMPWPHGQHPQLLGHQDTPDLLFSSSVLTGFLFALLDLNHWFHMMIYKRWA